MSTLGLNIEPVVVVREADKAIGEVEGRAARI